VYVYDPVLKAMDKEVLEEWDCSVMDDVEASEHEVRDKTLFYMPHCEAPLYNDVMDANWSPERLRNIAVLGNSYNTMHVR
jgi:hypothetical protein